MQISLRDILNKIFMNKFYIIIFSFVLIISLVTYYFVAPKKYKSTAKILVKLGYEQTGSLSFLTSQKNIFITRRKQDLKNEAEIFKSDIVITKTAQKLLGKKKNNLKKLSKMKKKILKNLNVKPVFESDTLEISYKDRDPYLAQKTLKILTQNYLDLHLSTFSSIKELNLLETEVNKYKNKYKKLEEELINFMKKNNFYGDKGELLTYLKIKQELYKNLTDAIANYKYYKSKVNRIKSLMKTVKSYILSGITEIRNRSREDIEAKLREAELERKSMLLKYQPDSRFVKDIEEEINLLKKLRDLQPEYVIDRKEKTINTYYNTLKEMLIKYETEMLGAKSKILVYKEEIDKLTKKLNKYLSDLGTYELLNKEVKLNKYMYENFFKYYSQAKLKHFSEKSKIVNVSIIEPPSLALTPVWPELRLLSILGVALLILGNFSIVSLTSFFDTRIRFPYEIEKFYKGKFLVDFPELEKENSNLIQEKLFKKFIKKYQKSLTKLKRYKTFLFTSTNENEGVTTIAKNFVNFLKIYHNKNVAYITLSSANNNPKENKEIFDFEKDKLGIDYYIFNILNISSGDIYYKIIQTTKDKINELKNRYEILVIDCSPLENIIDIVYLTDLIDSTIFIIEAEKVKKEVIDYNLDLANDFGLKNYYFILNKRKFYLPDFIIKYV